MLSAQERVLVFTKVGAQNGFEHASIDEGVQLITDLGTKNDLWQTDQSGNASVFTSENLAKYSAVIWCNTSGDDLLDTSQQQAFEEYIANGGGFMGIHAATDTYRNGSWPFYNELVGGIIQANPNHTANNYQATMTVINSHPAVDFLENGYPKAEEYYYWERNGGYLFQDNINILEVEATGSETYDEARPMSWYKEYKGGRSFYTALGHNESDYTGDANFRKHIEEGIKYVMGITLGIESESLGKTVVFPNPASARVNLQSNSPISQISVYNIQGRLIKNQPFTKTQFTSYSLDSSAWSPGIYFIQLNTTVGKETIRIVKE